MQLMQRERVAPLADLPQRWLLLEAAHVLGQTRLRPHLVTHAQMLALGWETRDGREVLGQLLRLLLVPLGHLTGRLPLGNAGRSNISAFQTMPIREDIAALIEQVAQAVDGTR
ncbi:MAG: hypothetical protein CVU24_00595 [Betaproteobacteria bacterium HGW-Betaproteobacteria-18]|nr:MAG: hypothetical protein CVU24_00595 [Betaproteobacteria bacterium HGW-Betaproteobacteria-18]